MFHSNGSYSLFTMSFASAYALEIFVPPLSFTW